MLKPLFIVQIALLIGTRPPSQRKGTDIGWTDASITADWADGSRFHGGAFSATSVHQPLPPFPQVTSETVLTDQGVANRPTAATSFEKPISTAPKPEQFSGCGSLRDNMLKPLFIVQVSGKRHYGLRSNNLFLIVLPHPQRLLCIFAECFDLCNLLLLSGDIESNPGPDTEETLQKLLVGQNKIFEAIKEIKFTQRKVEERIGAIEETVESFKSVSKNFDIFSSTVLTLKQTVSSLENKVDDLENRMRRNNLIFFGIPENLNETKRDLEKVIISEILEDKLGIENVGVERIHRIGRPNKGKSRPVILKLFDYNVKENILRNARKLKGTKISISEDFSIHIRQKRKLLWNSAKEDRDKGEKVVLRFDKLIVGNSCYQWDPVKNARILINSRQRDDRNAQSNNE
ncbi:uncharacterized protein LOC120838065 [Ixodes scapularis]|uniref:uncharacterized protein LOC120838065 n=1 Tax=Ixodes scapularis TaxID=6945 RepID=UPI001161603D|nr:uncharacterized protein LOC120838065 [Ixodes scapularis]